MTTTPRLRVGDTPPDRVVGPVTLTDIVRFAGAGGDFNPLHHDVIAARASGFPDVIAMGQFQAALLAGLLGDWVGVENVVEFSVRFRSPLVVRDEVRLAAAVVDVDPTATLVDLTATVGDRIVVSASARVRLPD